MAAAVVALVIATKDRKERRDERRAAERTQARLVQVEAVAPPDMLYYRIEVHNHGAQPIINVTLDQVRLRDHDAEWKLENTSAHVVRIIGTGTDAHGSFLGTFYTADGEPITKIASDTLGNTIFGVKPDVRLIEAVVLFTDANGNRWTTDTNGVLMRVGTAD
ncbi:hypothetical protein A5633_17070 [Mycolicibacterium elephantis]|nr:hypothetical protein A5633_17070 [Mycolicibacterium elephantis]